MLGWLAQYGAGISAATSMGMLLVWVVYLGLFLRQYLRQTQPKIVINRAAGTNLDATCFVSNMSSEPIYVEAISVAFEDGNEVCRAFVTDIVTEDGDDVPGDPRQRTRQGPMRSGEYMPIGSFQELLDRLGKVNRGGEPIRLEEHQDPALRVRILADYASEDMVIGAERLFKLERTDGIWMPRTGGNFTYQLRSRRSRRRAQEELDQAG